MGVERPDLELSEAVVAYLSAGTDKTPRRNPAAVVSRFGASRGGELNRAVEELVREFDAVEIDWARHTLSSATEAAESRMRAAHPELTEEAIDALAWHFSWIWR